MIAATGPHAYCDCFGQYDRCVARLGCPAATIAAVIKSCESAGCPTATCTETANAPVAVAPVKNDICDAKGLRDCTNSQTYCNTYHTGTGGADTQQ
jgi:hypothetical protein